jgi:hypothetical protein
MLKDLIIEQNNCQNCQALQLAWKQKNKGSKVIGIYLMIPSGVLNENLTFLGIVVLCREDWENKILRYEWISPRTIILRIKIVRAIMTIIGICELIEGKYLKMTELYDKLLQTIIKESKTDYLITALDLLLLLLLLLLFSLSSCPSIFF